MDTDKRRPEGKLGPGAPTQLTLSYQAMDERRKGRLFWIGVGLLVFTVGLPLVAGIWVDLPKAYWLFAFGGGITGLAMIWPEAAIFVFGSFGRFVPVGAVKALVTRVERRGPPES